MNKCTGCGRTDLKLKKRKGMTKGTTAMLCYECLPRYTQLMKAKPTKQPPKILKKIGTCSLCGEFDYIFRCESLFSDYNVAWICNECARVNAHELHLCSCGCFLPTNIPLCSYCKLDELLKEKLEIFNKKNEHKKVR